MVQEGKKDEVMAPAPTSLEEEKPQSAAEGLANIIALLEKAVKLKDTRLLQGRLLRQTAVVRKHLAKADLAAFLQASLPGGEAQGLLLQAVEQAGAGDAAAMDADDPQAAVKAPHPPSQLPEVELFAYMLVLMFQVDRKQWQQARTLSDLALTRLKAFNRRTLDVIGARIFFYYSMAAEQLGQLAEVRSALMAAHRTAVLRHDALGAETLLNLLMRNYLAYKLYDQAEKFRSKAQKGDTWRSPPQWCRYLFQLGTIRAIQLEYSEARDCLQQAVRKAPTGAPGFRLAASKWLILVRLLLGEVPDRSEFATPGMTAPLAPYLQLTAAVRAGDLAAFTAVAAQHAPAFRADGTNNLVTRLHHNVIRTGLRRISLAYSRISLKDVASKLALPSAEDAEFIVAKAIRDGGIDAVIDHAAGFLQSRELLDVYATSEPQSAFHQRIAFCLDIHNEAIKAMRFEPGAHKAALESDADRKRRLADEEEIAKALAEEDEDDF